jgi:hypothetical protein
VGKLNWEKSNRNKKHLESEYRKLKEIRLSKLLRKTRKGDEFTRDAIFLRNNLPAYSGSNTFLLDIKKKGEEFGYMSLSQKQVFVAKRVFCAQSEVLRSQVDVLDSTLRDMFKK